MYITYHPNGDITVTTNLLMPFAAAPDLLEALESGLQVVEELPLDYDTFRSVADWILKTKRAIAKARGTT